MSSAAARQGNWGSGATRAFLDEEWLTPIQIARKFGYATDKPIRRAIMRGELKATRAPCRRKLLVAESEVLRWVDQALVFEPKPVGRLETGASPTEQRGRGTRRRTMPRLSYDTSRQPSA
jgi:hypothetical protein